jgi:arginase
MRLISVPFHNGLKGVRMGAGAARLAADAELRAGLEAAGWEVGASEIEPVDESEAEITRTIELIRRLAGTVRGAVEEGEFPLVLAGNCNSSLGTAAGLGGERLGVVWFDAHADFDDPEENTSGFFDVMGLAMLTGRGWRALRGTIPGHRPVPEANVVLAGVRDLEPYQRERLEASQVHALPGAIDRQGFADAISELAESAPRAYLHVDLDSVDSAEARANEYAAPGGPSAADLCECIGIACERLDIAGAAITAYDPSLDDDGRTLRLARNVARAIANGVDAA